MSDKLLPCPFCGGEAEFNDTSSTWVRCQDCGAETQCQIEKKDAALLWNRRETDATKDAEIAELKAQLASRTEQANMWAGKCGEQHSQITRLREALKPFAFEKSSLNFARLDEDNAAWVAVDGAGSGRVCFFVRDVLGARAALSGGSDA